jgi:VWFA-related protein
MKKVALLMTLVLLLSRASAFSFSQDSTPLVHTNTRVVLLDVVVTDKAGNPIRTLTRDDFTVSENGVPQKISSFEPPVPSASSILPNSPRTIILLDELNIAYADLSYARDRIMLFLAQNHLQQTPISLMTLNLRGLSVLQDYTQDHELLKEKLMQFRPAMLNPVEGEGEQGKVQEHAQRSINSLIDIAHASLGSSYNLNVIWVTGGFAGALKDTKSADGTQNGLRRLANLLMSARIRLYTIDPGGVKPLAATVVATPSGDKMSASNHLTGTHNNDDLALLGTAYEANQLLTVLTGMMGGHAFYGRNDVEVALSQAVADGAANYSLSYSPSNTDFKGEYRKIEIHTNIEGATARTRLGYYADADAPAPTPEMREVKWTAALSSPLAYAAFALTCPLTYNASTGRATGTLTVKPTPIIMEAEQQSREIIRVAGLSNSGAILTSWSWQIDWKKTWTNRVTTASFDKVLPKKTHSVRFLVSDPASEHIGTCDYPIP